MLWPHHLSWGKDQRKITHLKSVLQRLESSLCLYVPNIARTTKSGPSIEEKL